MITMRIIAKRNTPTQITTTVNAAHTNSMMEQIGINPTANNVTLSLNVNTPANIGLIQLTLTRFIVVDVQRLFNQLQH